MKSKQEACALLHFSLAHIWIRLIYERGIKCASRSK